MSDYISREALKEAFENADADVCERFPDGYCDWGFGRQNIQDVIASVPAADVEPVRHGEWLRTDDDWSSLVTIQCSVCGGEWCFEIDEDVQLLGYNYCPGCGCKWIWRMKPMTIDRAIEILNPEHREHYDGMDEVNEACRMGMEALERTRWIPCSERLPESDEVWQKYIVAYRYRYRDIWDDMGENAVVTVANYCHEQKVWSMDGGTVINALIDSEDVQPWASYITHWKPLPELPKEENDETIDG